MTEHLIFSKNRSRRGISRAAFILIIAIAVVGAIASVPLIIHWRDTSREIGCMAAMDTANKELATAYIASSGKLSLEEARDAVAYAMNGWDDLCPGGGTVQMIETDRGGVPYKIVCGMHEKDEKERTRANAAYVFDFVKERVRIERLLSGGTTPETVTLTLNGETLVARLSEDEIPLPRGTRLIVGWEGDAVAAYYCVTDGKVTYFAFADEKHSAVWKENEGWTGDSHIYD